LIVPECRLGEKFRADTGVARFKKINPGTDPELELKNLQTGFRNGKNMPI